MTTTAPHVLVITGEEDHRDYDIECPGVTDDCRAYGGCNCPESRDQHGDALWDNAEAHGVEHKHIDGEWMRPTDQCYVSTSDNLPDVCEELAKREQLGPGRHPIDFDYQGEGWYELQLLTPVAD